MKYLKRQVLLLLIVLFNQQAFAQYDIKIEISDSKDTALILGYYYLDKTYALDTAWNKKNTFNFKSKDKKLDSGIYFFSNFSSGCCSTLRKSFTATPTSSAEMMVPSLVP